MRLLELRDPFQFFIPPSFELARDQPVIRVDAFILALRQARVVPGLLELQLPLAPLASQVVFNLIQDAHRDRQALG